MSEERTPDGLLLRRYRGGDEAAFAEIRRRHGRLVLATCRRETGDAALAEDAAQGTFLLLTRKAFAEDASLAGWLHHAARLVSRNLVREEGRRRRRERRAFEEATEPDRAWEAVSPHIDAALDALKPGDREAVLLRFSGEMSLAEVGAALGVEENAARMRVSRALERLRAHLRRAGVGVAAALLASLLSTRLVDAATLSSAPPSARAVRLAKRGLPVDFGSVPLSILVGTLALGFGAVGARTFRSNPRLDSMGTKILFSKSVGAWKGTLEYADDRTGARTKTAVAVVVDRTGGGLRLVATYPAFQNVDTTTFLPDGQGRFRVANGGAGSSHRLDGLYDLLRAGDGAAFVGFSPAVGGDVRLSVGATPDALTLQEEVRRGAGGYRFRNRFDLTRVP